MSHTHIWMCVSRIHMGHTFICWAVRVAACVECVCHTYAWATHSYECVSHTYAWATHSYECVSHTYTWATHSYVVHMNVYVTPTHGPHIHTHSYECVCHTYTWATHSYVYVPFPYGISRLPQITGLFCGISSLFQGSFAKETYDASRLRDAVDETESAPMKWLQWVGAFKIIGLVCKRAL